MPTQISYRLLQIDDLPVLTEMCLGLSVEDPGDFEMTPEKVARTAAELQAHPDKGQVMVFVTEADEVVGYAILLNVWSNEFGGNITTVDELYVKAPWRGQGIATDFMAYVEKIRLAGAIAVELEVLPGNIRAHELYLKLGFEKHPNQVLIKHLA